MGISNSAVSSHFRASGRLKKRGKILVLRKRRKKYWKYLFLLGEWSPSEEQRLSSAVSEAQKGRRKARDDLTKSITWKDVASRVGSRNATQCR